MPKVSIKKLSNVWSVRFDFPDTDSKVFKFLTQQDAEDAIELARYVQANDISLNNVTNN